MLSKLSVTLEMLILRVHLMIGDALRVSIKLESSFLRFSVDENEEFLTGYKVLIEETFEENGKKPVVIICHSMGCTFTYYFFKQQDPTWLSQFISTWFIIGAPFGGTFKYMYGFFGDDDYPASMFPIIRKAERTFSTAAFLLPSRRAFSNDVVLVSTPDKNYTTDNYEEFFLDLNDLDSLEKYKDVKDLLGNELNIDDLGFMKVVCVGGTGEQTLESTDFFTALTVNENDRKYKAVYGDGDGFLQTRSMRECLKFNTTPNDFTFKEFQLDHMQLIQHPTSINYLINLLQGINKQNRKKKTRQ